MHRPELLRLLLPPTLSRTSGLRFRFDPAPLAEVGVFDLVDVGVRGPEVDGEEASRLAVLEAHKDEVRRAGAEAEAVGLVELPALPQAMTLELTARCNLRCPHCSSHGTPELDRRYNAMAELSPERLEALVAQAFPSLTTLGLVGRGEPLLVSGALWGALVAGLRRHRVRLTLVTNGTLVRRRLRPELMDLLETVHVSIDGGEEATFAENRVGARLEPVLDALGYLIDTSRRSGLARRPRIGVSWTLKENNVDELSGFVERAVAMGIDQLTVRHLLIFHDKDRAQSLVDRPERANAALAATYRHLEAAGVRSDCPPLATHAAPGAAETRDAPRDGCMFVRRNMVVHADGLIPTCPAPFAVIAGRLDGDRTVADVWNGEVLRRVRTTLGSDDELSQCRNCWYREGRYESQRQRFDTADERYELRSPDTLTLAAWDFRDFSQD